MKKYNPRNVLDRAQRRLRRARPGSVLILVVALLILMAIIGTAYMSMAQADRTTAAIHTNNTEIDMLMDGVVNMVKGNILGELYTGGGKFRNQQSSSNFSGYNNFTGLGVDPALLVNTNQSTGSTWLDDRLPVVPDIRNGPTALGGGNDPYWSYITAPLAGTQFSTPYWNPAALAFLEGQTTTLPGDVYHYTQRDSTRASLTNRLVPGFIQLNGQFFPAWRAPNGNPNAAILAADADGDGIADSGYVKLPIGSINGVTYYVAVRVVDNAAAINANTATWPNDTSGVSVTAFPGDFFPTAINLQRFLYAPPYYAGNPADSFQSVLAFRNNPNYVIPAFVPVDDINSSPASQGNIRNDFSYFVDTPATPPVPPYAGLDMYWTQLGRRLDNPGRAAQGVSFQSLSINDSIALAKNFVLQDLSPSSIIQQLLPISTNRSSPQTSPYVPASVASMNTTAPQWFSDNFTYYDSTPSDRIKLAPARPLLVARNPVSNFAPNKFQLRSASADIANFGDYLTINGRGYVYTGPPIGSSLGQYPSALVPYPPQLAFAKPPPTGVTIPTHLLDSFWAPEPWADAPTKISVNIGTFNQLWTAFWSLMTDHNIVPSFRPGVSVLGPGPFANLDWGVPYGTESRQFFSPVRDPTIGYNGNASAPGSLLTPKTPRATGRPAPLRFALLPAEVLKLRAAIAAANAVALRSSLDCTINSHRIFLVGQKAYDGSTQKALASPVQTLVQATVYGNKPQPYILAVYADNDTNATGGTPPAKNPSGYVGVQLYNPYSFPIDLTNCQLGIIQGRRITDTAAAPIFPNMVVAPITGFTGFSPAGNGVAGQTPVVPANGYLVLENYAGGTSVNPRDAVYRPTLVDSIPSVGDPLHKFYYVPNLADVMQDPGNPAQRGGELVLLRPRLALPRASAAAALQFSAFKSSVPGEYDENQLADMIPLDSFDFSALQVAATSGPYTGIYYRRCGDPVIAANKWKWVYPGRWDPSQPWSSAAPDGFNQEGTEVIQWPSTGTSTTAKWDPQLPIAWENSSAPPQMIPTFKVLPQFPAIQLFNTDFPGPNAVPVGGKYQYPYGTFARNGDILQAPFIGAYTLKEIVAVDPVTNLIAYPPTSAGNPNMIVEMNPVTLDSQQADDYDSYPAAGGTPDDRYENIGRFCPMDGRDFTLTPPQSFDDFSPLPATDATVNSPFWRYHFAMQLLDYVTVQSPQDDQFPAADPLSYLGPPPQAVNHKSNNAPASQTYGRVGSMAGNTITGTAFFFPNVDYGPPHFMQFLSGPARGAILQIATAGSTDLTTGACSITVVTAPAVLPLPNDVFVIYGDPEPTQGLNGLVNVNSASWRVLAAVPMVPNAGTPGPAQTLNSQIAFSIVYYRDIDDGGGIPPVHGHGPFKNLFELNRVPIRDFSGALLGGGFTFRDAIRATANSSLTADFTNAEGDLSPFGGSTTDGIVGDFEGTFLMMNRISNLLTTRSDSFTAYILLEGWQDAETANPKLVVRRRAAYIIDRSSVTPNNPSPTLTNIPTGN